MRLSISTVDLPAGWLSAGEAAALAELAYRRRVLEIGAYLGRSTVVLAECAELVVSVDHHRGSSEHQPGAAEWRPELADGTAAAYLANLSAAGVTSRVVPIIGGYRDVLPLLAPATFDLVFLDADHREEATVEAATLALPLVRRPGILVFHDYDAIDYPGVRAAVDRLAAILHLGRGPVRLDGSLAALPVLPDS